MLNSFFFLQPRALEPTDLSQYISLVLYDCDHTKSSSAICAQKINDGQ